MKIVFDTNTLISAVIARGKPNDLLLRAIAKEFILITSAKLLKELEEVVSRPKFKLSQYEVKKFIGAIRRTVEIVTVRAQFKVIKEDPDDDLILNTAVSGKANYIVSGDTHLLKLKNFRGTKIVTANKMLEILNKRSVQKV